MKTNTFKKALSLILAVAMCFTVITVPVFAEDATDITTQRNKIYNLTSQDNYKTDNNGYQTEEEAVKTTGKIVIGEWLEDGDLCWYNRGDKKFSVSDDMIGASYIRTPRNHSHIETVNTQGTFTRTVGDGEAETKTCYNGSSSDFNKTGYGFRKNYSLDTKAWFNGAFSAQNGEPGWIEFYVTSDCTVVVGDVAKCGWPNLDKTAWTASDGNTNKVNGTSYWRHYDAGSLVQIPNYGIGGTLADTTKVVYSYTDTDGNAQVYETTVGADKIIWDDIVVAIKWDDPISMDTTLASVAVGETEVDLTAMDENNTVTVTVPYGTTDAALTVTPTSDVATVDAPETVSVGTTAEVTVTAESGHTATYYVNVVEAEFVFEVEVSATDEYKALFADGKYTGNHVIKASA